MSRLTDNEPVRMDRSVPTVPVLLILSVSVLMNWLLVSTQDDLQGLCEVAADHMRVHRDRDDAEARTTSQRIAAICRHRVRTSDIPQEST